jgi:hypothetical protein
MLVVTFVLSENINFATASIEGWMIIACTNVGRLAHPSSDKAFRACTSIHTTVETI